MGGGGGGGAISYLFSHQLEKGTSRLCQLVLERVF